MKATVKVRFDYITISVTVSKVEVMSKAWRLFRSNYGSFSKCLVRAWEIGKANAVSRARNEMEAIAEAQIAAANKARAESPEGIAELNAIRTKSANFDPYANWYGQGRAYWGD